MNLTQTIIVYGAGIIGAITSFPQLYQIIKTKKVRDINPYFFVLHVLSDALFLTYGLMTKDNLLSISMALPFVIILLVASISLIIGLYSEWIYLNAKTLDNESNAYEK